MSSVPTSIETATPPGAELHVAQVSFYQDPQRRAPEDLLIAWPTMVDVAEAACGAGARVSVIQACSTTQTLTRNGVSYYFISAGSGAPLGRLLQSLRPSVLHVHGLGAPQDVLALAKLAPNVPILVQDHASAPPRLWRRGPWRTGMARAAAVSFSSRRQAEPFEQAHLFDPATRILEIPEATSRFSPGDQTQARRLTGLHGNPCLLWVGHLDANKDPLTVLAGVSKAVERFPQLQLWCAYLAAPLLAEVEKTLREDERLRTRVHLLGRTPHERVQQLMHAADLFVLGSHRESCGFALLEALASGVAPIVTDIPSFRSLTGDGAVGRLWTCQQPASFAGALESFWSSPPAHLRRTVRAHFDHELSPSALGRKLVRAYRQLAGPGGE